jgi:hypothetical protein
MVFIIGRRGSMKNDTPFMETMKVIKEFLISGKVGNIVVNCFKGGITTVNVNETIKWKKDK